LHTPDEIPAVGEQFYRLPTNQELYMAVQPVVMTTSSDLKPYLPEKNETKFIFGLLIGRKKLINFICRRQCLFEDERKLQFFQTYKLNNCNLECLANYIYFECKCVPFDLPSKYNREGIS
jgi:hypothetical protein